MQKNMLTTLNEILQLYTLPGLIFGFGLCFFFICIPDNEELKGYKMAIKMMGGAYLVCFLALIAGTLPVGEEGEQLLKMAISCSQALFFTFALITLIDVRFFTWKRFLCELFIVLVPMAVAVAVGPLLLAACYLVQITWYTIRFRRHYSDYERRMVNYFSDDERRRLHWVRTAFYSALALGVYAFIYSLWPSIPEVGTMPTASAVMTLVFTIVMGAYYATLAILFINHAFMLKQMEVAMRLSTKPSDRWITDEEQWITDHERLEALMTEKRLYTKPDLTIEELAVMIGEPCRNVSETINSMRDGQNTTLNFKTWVNRYRVEEAKKLIRNGFLEWQTTEALAEAVGFNSRITLHRVFKKFTGYSPTDYSSKSLPSEATDQT